MSGFKLVGTGPNPTEGQKMVILKEKVWRNKDGKAVADGHPDAAFLIGPKGAKIDDRAADALGLENGALPKSGRYKPEPKPLSGTEKLLQQVEEEKKKKATEADGEAETTRLKMDILEETVGTPAGDEAAGRREKIKAEMRNMANDVDTMTAAGVPDSFTLSSRLGFQVKAPERNEVWAEVEEELTAP